MYISELELHGFKSFAYKTHVKFDNGITAIVGPNGCGKSNIVDALRWVLGEQRPTLLRSSSMSNVIFNGTAKKKALGMADVSLTFVNNKGILPVEYSELTITRRLYRSGDSEYLINNTPCRLKDIMDLFMDTGMSSDAYSVIELKMVEEILNDRNNDRRRLFEEAAGVTRYKEKRKQTLRKLDETLKDLQRLEDILIEIRKKVRSLEIQAGKAEKAKAYRTELESLDQAFSLTEFKNIENELQPLQTRISNAEKEKKEINAKVTELESADEEARTNLLQKERTEAELKRKAGYLFSSVREIETSIKILEEKILNEKGVIEQYTSDIEQSKIDIEELQKLKSNNETQLKNLTEEKASSEKSLQKSKDTFSEVQQKYTKIRHELYELEISISDYNQKLNTLQSNRIKLESKLENSDDDQVRIAKDIEKFQSEIATARSQFDQTGKLVASMNQDIAAHEKKLSDTTQKRKALELEREQIRESVRTLKSERDAVLSETSLLKSIADSNEAIPRSVSYLMDNHAEKFNLLISVGEIIQTSEEFVYALEAALGNSVNYIVTESWDEARLASRLLADNDEGQATFIPLSELQKSYPVAKSSILDKVIVEKKFNPIAQLLLGQTVLAADLNSAKSMLSDSGISAVTANGEFISKNRFLKGGSRNKQAGVRLGLKDKLEKLDKKEKDIHRQITDKESVLEDIQQRFGLLNLELIRQDIKESQKKLREYEQTMSRFQSSIQVYEKSISDLKNRQDTLVGNRELAVDELEQLQPQQKEFQQKILELSNKQDKLKVELQNLEEERAIAQNRFNDARLKHQDVTNRADNLSKDIERAENGIISMKSRLESRSELLIQSTEKIKSYSKSIDESKVELEKLTLQKEAAESKLKEAEQASSQQRGLINENDKELRDLRRKKEVNLELVHHLTMAREKFEMQAQALADHIWETYGILMDQLTESLDEETDPATAKARVAELRQKLQRIGEVNPLAIEEYGEEKERLDFYEEQIDDLQKAEREMRETIDEINETATSRFNETFDSIRTNFKTVFATLFEADDQCDLIIEKDADDPLEAKIEITANPRGKRPSSINQLSGGEKTLTAIALLFAIYLVKPSPFCVLDEVDAPLDDANIERFSQMIRKFSDDTQFIIITHNKKTMSKAEMMYGVTMPETGVSRLVGVRLDEVTEN